ncbi:MAG TPA: aspartyl/asparaginyl beta-hydroxylase domain-containing protein [Flavisolibacter sp.]|nr:aspartyl/asparaginyl beta-hydroxylase domain-containing protein [Flavisolibacter sp.]
MSKSVKGIVASFHYRLEKTMVEPLRSRFERMSFPFMERLVKEQSLVGDHTFFNNDQFPWIAKLEANWKEIRQELDHVMETTNEIPSFQDVSKQQKQLTQDNKWRTFFFCFYGHRRDENCRLCPRTMELLKSIPNMKTAFFSILSPHKHIPPHRGPYNGVLRLHLGLQIPKDRMNCKIRVGNDFGLWEEGKALIFDDSYEHEVWNNTEEIRVVLFVDFVRPLPLRAAFLNRLYIKYIAASKFIQDAVGNLDKIKVGKTIVKAKQQVQTLP